MSLLEFLEPPKQEFVQCNNFVVFEPVSSRIAEHDVLCRGDALMELFEMLTASPIYDDKLKIQILGNRLSRIQMMLSLANNPENIVVTKFVKKVWKRYPFYSNLGEPFLELSEYLHVFPDFADNTDPLLVQRLVGGPEDDEGSDDDDESSDDESGDDESTKDDAK